MCNFTLEGSEGQKITECSILWNRNDRLVLLYHTKKLSTNTTCFYAKNRLSFHRTGLYFL